MDGNKTITLRFRMNADKRKRIESRAEQAGLSVRECVCRVATSQIVQEKLPATLQQTLVGVANNPNQLTRYAHQRQFDDQAINQIVSALQHALYWSPKSSIGSSLGSALE